jgi:hypothetical protein
VNSHKTLIAKKSQIARKSQIAKEIAVAAQLQTLFERICNRSAIANDFEARNRNQFLQKIFIPAASTSVLMFVRARAFSNIC